MSADAPARGGHEAYSGNASPVASAARMSNGISMYTGRGRAALKIENARASAAGSSPGSVMAMLAAVSPAASAR